MNTKLTIEEKTINTCSTYLPKNVSEKALQELAQQLLNQEAKEEHQLACRVLREMKTDGNTQ